MQSACLPKTALLGPKLSPIVAFVGPLQAAILSVGGWGVIQMAGGRSTTRPQTQNWKPLVARSSNKGMQPTSASTNLWWYCGSLSAG